jgi:hypothetical protein
MRQNSDLAACSMFSHVAASERGAHLIGGGA